MVKLINKLTGTVMRVSEDRAEEYAKSGHKPVNKEKKTAKKKKKAVK